MHTQSVRNVACNYNHKKLYILKTKKLTVLHLHFELKVIHVCSQYHIMSLLWSSEQAKSYNLFFYGGSCNRMESMFCLHRVSQLDTLESTWASIPVESFRNLLESMPRRIGVSLRAKEGGNSKLGRFS